MNVHRSTITNGRDGELRVIVEPWGAAYDLPSCDRLTLVMIGPAGAGVEVVDEGDSVTWHGWAGARLFVMRGGVVHGATSSIAAVVEEIASRRGVASETRDWLDAERPSVDRLQLMLDASAVGGLEDEELRDNLRPLFNSLRNDASFPEEGLREVASEVLYSRGDFRPAEDARWFESWGAGLIGQRPLRATHAADREAVGES